MDDDRFIVAEDALADLREIFGLSRGAAENKLRQICAEGDVRIWRPQISWEGGSPSEAQMVHGEDLGPDLPDGLLVNERDFDWWLDRNAKAANGCPVADLGSASHRRFATDEALVTEARAGLNSGKWANPHQAAQALAKGAEGGGTLESRVSRIERKIAASKLVKTSQNNSKD
jgi:hypothetical protein